MFLKNISISQFKSHSSATLQLGQGVNCIVGKNGVGKTNLLDAVYCLLNGKSYFQMTDALCILKGETYYLLKGNLQETDETESHLMVSFQIGKRKAIRLNDEPVNKLAEFFGKYPCVVIAPDDVEIINGESDQRRRFFDYMLSVVDSDYLKHLSAYNKVLEARNKQLKVFLEHDNFDAVLLDYYDTKLELHGAYIFKVRQESTAIFEAYFNKVYAEIAAGVEVPVFKFISKLHDSDFRTGFTQTLNKDRILGRTSFGTHRDDWSFELNGMPLKKTGSQGQIKSFLIALKLAMYNFIYEMPRGSLAELLPIKKGIPFDIDLKNKHEITNEKRNVKPLLLLDDIFEKIDTSRMQQLVEIISKPEMGQVIITDTNKKRVEEYFEGRGEVGFFEL